MREGERPPVGAIRVEELVGLLLADSAYQGTATRGKVLTWAGGASAPDPSGLRRDFLDLARKAKLPK